MTIEREDQPLLSNNRRVNTEPPVSTNRGYRRYFVFTGIAFLLLFLSFFAVLILNQGNINYVQEIHKYFAHKNLDNLLNKEGLPKNLPLGCTATVLILPHCEADRIPHTLNHRLEDSCNYLGIERSYYLITQFGSNQRRWPVPFNILTLTPKSSDGSSSSRAIETATPIQQYFKMNSTDSRLYNDIKSMVQQVAHDLLQGSLCGQLVVLIPNDNDDISNIAFQFGCSDCPPFWSGNYDEAWELRFVYDLIDNSYDMSGNPNVMTNDTDKQPTSSASASFRIYFASVRERFDALQFSKSVGEFTPNGMVRENPKWMNMSTYNND